ncbi:AAA family ATPase [Waterburya agarophytonicola K14]|uniref:AAA family ATPase n=1 Tax=Waterburya agarophytonicola KI4 TaxID=2874699 RepID=A0A964BPA9_9CYAN|nr:AAA family ATPase [Waterburya agarophytonicola]MCC0176316.1 AAA family ATPase [Waterburya agarophytonicola KI4]
MKKVLILQGLPASGKSQFAKELLLANPGRWVRTNKDLLREMAHASYWSKGNEKFILQLRDTTILMALKAGKHVVIDDTNFGHNIDRIKELVAGKARVIINDSFLKVPVEECIRRDLLRPKSVGKDVIMKMYNQFVRSQVVKPVIHNPDLPDAIIVDMDGTLAIMGDRSPFDVSRCDLDLPNYPVLETVHKWQDSKTIIIMSGRTDDGKEKTEGWLNKYGVKYQHIYMRKTGDLRKDSTIKQELYENHIKDKYNIVFILDDRQQVVDMWRGLGLTVFQVAEGDF